MSEDKSSGCYWDLRNGDDLIVISINVAVTVMLMIQIIKSYAKAAVYLSYGYNFYIYYFMIAWAITYLVQNIYSIVTYLAFNEDLKQNIQTHSIIYETLDFAPAFILISLLYFISWHRIKNIYQKCDQIGKPPSNFEICRYKLLIAYQRVRLLIVIPPALLFISHIVSLVDMLLFLLDSLICNIVLFLATRTLLKKYEILDMGSAEKKLLKIQSYLLQAAGFFRLGLDIAFNVINMETQNDNKSCFDKNSKYRSFRTFAYLLVGQFGMHFLPIIIIIWSHRPRQGDMETLISRTSSEHLLHSQN